MKSFNYKEWEDWFRELSAEIDERENASPKKSELQLDEVTLSNQISALFQGDEWIPDWNYSFEIDSSILMISIAVYDSFLFDEIFTEKIAPINDSLILDWIIRIEYYPQIREGIKYGDSSIREIFITKKQIHVWEK